MTKSNFEKAIINSFSEFTGGSLSDVFKSENMLKNLTCLDDEEGREHIFTGNPFNSFPQHGLPSNKWGMVEKPIKSGCMTWYPDLGNVEGKYIWSSHRNIKNGKIVGKWSKPYIVSRKVDDDKPVLQPFVQTDTKLNGVKITTTTTNDNVLRLIDDMERLVKVVEKLDKRVGEVEEDRKMMISADYAADLEDNLYKKLNVGGGVDSSQVKAIVNTETAVLRDDIKYCVEKIEEIARAINSFIVNDERFGKWVEMVKVRH